MSLGLPNYGPSPNSNMPFSMVYECEAVIPLKIPMPLLRVALATKMTKEDNDWLHLQELEALDEKRLQVQQHIELYQIRISKAFNKKVKKKGVSERRLGFSRQTTYRHETQNQRQILTQIGRAIRGRNSLLKWGLLSSNSRRRYTHDVG